MLAERLIRVSLLCVLVALLTPVWMLSAIAADAKPAAEERAAALEEDVTQGALRVIQEDGQIVECPLRHTDVQAEVSGFIARVKVVQTFYNPTDEKIEAVYVFPLPHEAAVDEMTMVLGKRKVVGIIKRRAEAKQIYEAAIAAGQTAALLEQERPNIFTQSVGNIDPAQEVKIEISYVDVLRYDMGTYEFHFPMVVGPRFMPGAPIAAPSPTTAALRGAVSPPVPDTTRVPDASRISPPVLKPGFRNGHDVSLSLELDAGVPVMALDVPNHQATVDRQGKRRATVTLSPADSIPNKDFVLRYNVMGKKPGLAVLAHTGDYTDSKRLGHGYFMLMMQPKEDERLTKCPPREIVFLLDVSGSMSGQPTEKVKDAMRDMLKLCREVDTVQVITFASRSQQLFEKPVPVNRDNIEKAVSFTRGLSGSGGTQMLEGVKRAIDQPIDKERLRIVIMLTDGYIGNEAEIIEHVGTSCGDQIRFWAIGIGSSPNMFLIDGVARQGGGMGKRLGLEDSSAGLAEEVVTRIQRAQLSKIQINWGGLDVAETYPAKIPELWAGRPVILFGRYKGGGAAEISVSGLVEGEPISWPLRVQLPAEQSSHDVLAKVWARKKIEDLMQQTFYGGSPAVEEEVTAMALDYRLMSQYTSFVAVDAKDAEEVSKQRTAKPPRRMAVPVPLPAGTQWGGFFGDAGDQLEGLLSESLAKSVRGRTSRVDSLSIAAPHPFGGMGGMGGGGYGGRVATPARPSTPAAASPGFRQIPPVALMPQAGQTTHYFYSQLSADSAPGRYARTASRRSRGASPAATGRMLGLQPAAPTLGKVVTSFGAVAVDREQSVRDMDGLIFQALSTESEELARLAGEQLLAGQKHRKNERWIAAREALIQAYFLATAASRRGNYQASGTAAAALTDLESLRAEQVEKWSEDLPALSRKLDLVLRDASLPVALKAVSEEAGISIQLIEGSVQDAESLLGGLDARVTFLDLRGATLAQALDWILQPLRLTWRPGASDREDASGIVAGSDRRISQTACWVYDVSMIATPTEDEFDGLEDQAKIVERAKQLATQFVAGIRSRVKSSEQRIVWFAFGQLLVIGDTRDHELVGKAIAQLSDPTAELSGPLVSLHKLTCQRASESRERIEQLRKVNRLLDTAAVHGQFSWELLAAALDGRVDQEALTELEIVWRAAETKELLAAERSGHALRSAWAVIAASELLPENASLLALAASVRRQSRPACEQAIESLTEEATQPPRIMEAIYSALIAQDDALQADLLAALPASSDDPPASVARGLLGHVLSGDEISQIAPGSVDGEDLAVLFAMACHRAGGEAWSAYRANRRTISGKQPLPGSVIVLINRLPGHPPTLASLEK